MPAARRRREAKAERQAQRLRRFLSVLGAMSPALAARVAERTWRRVQVFAPPARELAWRASAQRRSLSVEGRELSCWCWGHEGPLVLLVHGWAGRGSQMAAFVEPLLAAGYRVIAPDLPGHGDDPQRHTDVAACARALLAIESAEGPVVGVVAHSFGVVAASLACREGLTVQRFVGIGSPAFGERMVGMYRDHLCLSARVWRALQWRMARRLGEDFVDRLSASCSARHCSMPALIVHDLNDRAVSWESGRAVADNWAGGAEFWRCEGLGHFRVLRDRAVIARSVEFIAGA